MSTSMIYAALGPYQTRMLNEGGLDRMEGKTIVGEKEGCMKKLTVQRRLGGREGGSL